MNQDVARQGEAWRGVARQERGSQWLNRSNKMRPGAARPGAAGRGMARARQGSQRLGTPNKMRRGLAWLGMAWPGKSEAREPTAHYTEHNARLGTARPGKAGHEQGSQRLDDRTKHGGAWLGRAGPGMSEGANGSRCDSEQNAARRGMARRGMASAWEPTARWTEQSVTWTD